MGDKVFVATDAPADLKDDLKKKVNGEVFFLGDSEEISGRFDHPGKKAAVEMWIAARADYFIGTTESRFTSHIQLERSWLGKDKSTSEKEFCKTFRKASSAFRL